MEKQNIPMSKKSSGPVYSYLSLNDFDLTNPIHDSSNATRAP